ncbi:laccase-10 [Selaginella moellendorffii]|uniref:laccase-10 n=1 Tax=Selaginella moellendorffii TaxID=88036 RepID=UPI000D1C4770|nr:laccase-10 [Selaginella moellendorffii]|eukprot:XP_024519170.1 laccase-10 [Selaginella moellendorffii]
MALQSMISSACRAVVIFSFLASWSFDLVVAQNEITKVYDFQVVSSMVRRLGRTKNIITVNGELPGPTIYANDGDRLLITVRNTVKYKMSIHWHGIRQFRSPWFDGPAYVTQCPLKQGQSFLYNFTVDSHMGTLFWHAHILWLRATVYGAIVIYPRRTMPYPFKSPYEEQVVILGEWWNNDIQAIEEDALRHGAPNQSDAYTINGFPGPSYKESEAQEVYTLNAITGKRYLLRLVNAALNMELFFSIANHSMTVVEVDAEYTKPYITDTILLTPGQTTNVVITADQPCARYFMSAVPYMSAQHVPYTPTAATAVLEYIACDMKSSTFATPETPIQPFFNDTSYATRFSGSLRSLASSQHKIDVPQTVDKEFLFAIGLGIKPCSPGSACRAPDNGNFTASINNVSFALPTKMSLMEAYYRNVPGIYSTDFPVAPVNPFDYTDQGSGSLKNVAPQVGTRISVIPYGSNVQIVFQNTYIAGFENHPIHLHGYNFYVLGYGFGNYDVSKSSHFNLVDPPLRNTIGVPSGGWAVIRFKADNPGVWYMHCHLEIHTTWGLATAILVTNGVGPDQSIVPPPDDYPQC